MDPDRFGWKDIVTDMGQWSGAVWLLLPNVGPPRGATDSDPRAVRDSWVSNAADQIQRPTVLRGFVKGRKLWGE